MAHADHVPFTSGVVERGDGAQIYWETSGASEGIPALYLHGGPGSGLGKGDYRRRYDPARYWLVAIDQRGCGRSRPLVVDDLASLRTNTTQTLIDDIEAVREQLAIDRWVITGVSWGSTLALAYAQAHPDRVLMIGLVAVTTTSRAEVEWITEIIGAIFPEAWHAFEEASNREPGERVVDAYARRLATGDPDDRERAAQDWDAWESTHISLDPLWTPNRRHPDPLLRLTFATLVTHYWSRDGFLTGSDAIMEQMGRIATIPGVLVHGRRDISGPAATAWRLHQTWPASDLVIVDEEGHGGPVSFEHLTTALDRYAANGFRS